MTKPPAACLIGWPAAHSRSPLIHHYWLRTLGIAGGYVIEAVPPDEFADFVFRLSLRGFVGANVTIPHKERALALSKPDAAPARSARPIRCGSRTASCARPTPMSKVLSTISTPARPAGTELRRRWCSAPAVRRARCCSDCSSAASSACILPTDHRAGAGAGGSVRRERSAGGMGCVGDLLPRAGLLVNTTSLGMKGQPPLELDVGAVAVRRRRRRSRLRAAAKRRCSPPRGPRPEDRRRARHAAAPGGARLRIVVRPAARSDGGTARAGRSRSHKYMIG